MATIALTRPAISHRSSAIDQVTPLDGITSTSATLGPAPIPNKYIPACPSGPLGTAFVDTPPQSPNAKGSFHEDVPDMSSTLYPPDNYTRIEHATLALYEINASQVAAALDHIARQPLPDMSKVFPWLHGLHPHNGWQWSFFKSHDRPPQEVPPTCLRAVTIVKADGDLSVKRLKGAIAPQEFMNLGETLQFLDVDPRVGLSVRNFHIQPAKIATVSDIIVYGDDEAQVRSVGLKIATAQKTWREKQESQDHLVSQFNTFICCSQFWEFEEQHAGLVAVDSTGNSTGRIIDFSLQERKEMFAMTKASEISHNVWLGPTPGPGDEDSSYDILIDCVELTKLNPEALRSIAESPDEDVTECECEFPASGTFSPTWHENDEDGILETCKWIYALAHGLHPQLDQPTDMRIIANGDGNGDTIMATTADVGCSPPKVHPRKILIHCADGYTESSLLAIAYFSYSTGRPIPDAWLDLHTKKQRNIFAYQSDVSLLCCLAPRLLCESPVCTVKTMDEAGKLYDRQPAWFPEIDGSLPSRILDYMYLGNLGHANNPKLLKALGISQVLSVGETTDWGPGGLHEWGEDNVCVVSGIQDNGVDSLTGEFEKCLDFIDRGRRAGVATLVHCRVGVSRSATICIAEVMRSLDYSFPLAYCFVRARRLNVIIQPHLRFVYELLKWEEHLKSQKSSDGSSFKRELEWSEVAWEISLINRPYSSH